MSRLTQFLGFLALIAAASWVLVRWLVTKGRAEYDLTAARLTQLRSIPNAEAARRAEALLVQGEVFRYVTANARPPNHRDSFAPLLGEFLGRYQSVETTSGQLTRVGHSDVGESKVKDGFVSIGRGMEATDVEYEIAVLPGKEEVFELHPGEEPDPVYGTYSTIHHWVLAVADEVVEQAGEEKISSVG
jgi:hypothetical protein